MNSPLAELYPFSRPVPATGRVSVLPVLIAALPCLPSHPAAMRTWARPESRAAMAAAFRAREKGPQLVVFATRRDREAPIAPDNFWPVGTLYLPEHWSHLVREERYEVGGFPLDPVDLTELEVTSDGGILATYRARPWFDALDPDKLARARDHLQKALSMPPAAFEPHPLVWMAMGAMSKLPVETHQRLLEGTASGLLDALLAS